MELELGIQEGGGLGVEAELLRMIRNSFFCLFFLIFCPGSKAQLGYKVLIYPGCITWEQCLGPFVPES